MTQAQQIELEAVHGEINRYVALLGHYESHVTLGFVRKLAEMAGQTDGKPAATVPGE